MKNFLISILVLLMILSSFNIIYGAESNKVKARFTQSDVSGTNFKEIKITPYGHDEEDEDYSYYIYLPSGYFVQDTSATYVADKNGTYPFTVYDGNNWRTFTYKVTDAEKPDKDNEDKDNRDKEDDKINLSFDLMYDYEKKQILLNMKTDKVRNIVTPDSSAITNEINYYIDDIDNNQVNGFTITVDEEPFDFKVLKQGEFYLLIYISPINYNNYSTVVEYYGYNFAGGGQYTAYPSKDIYDDNGMYEVLVKGEDAQQVFNFNIDDIDYRRPSVDVSIVNDLTFELEAADDFELAYIITYDGKYVPVNNTDDNSFIYKDTSEIVYNGNYLFTVVDKKGNRTVCSYKVKNKRKPTKFRPEISLDVHNYKNTKKMFENIGLEYKKGKDKKEYFENTLPGYMNGKSTDTFSPNSPISRAEMVTIFCRLNNLPYDSGAYLKTKFTDIENHWAKDYIAMGSKKKYVSGYKDKTFKPDNSVTRAEFCKMLTKISSYKTMLNTLPASSNYDYSDIRNHWAESDIIKISSRDLVTGWANYFYPDEPITRTEVVHAVNKLYGCNPSYKELEYINSLYNEYYNFDDINNHIYYNDIIISLVGMFREKQEDPELTYVE